MSSTTRDAAGDRRSERIRELINGGYARDQACAIAYEEERREAKAAGSPPPSRMDFVRMSRKIARGRSHEYLEAALAEAKSKLPHRDFAVLHAVARARAGGLASSRARTSTEKALLLGPSYLTEAELADALGRAEASAAAETRLGTDNGGVYLAEMFWAEKARRTEVKKGEPTSSDVHVDKPLGEEQAKKDEDKDEEPDSLAQARLAALAAQVREARDASVTIPSEPVIVQDFTPDGEILLSTMGEAGPVEMVAASAGLDLEPGDIVEVSADMTGDLRVEGPSSAVVPAKHEAVVKAATEAYERRRYETKVPFVGPADAPVVFVSGAPTELELARGEPLVGPDGAVFAEKYLAPLGLMKSEVAVGFACPVLPREQPHEEEEACGMNGNVVSTTKAAAPWKEWLCDQLTQWPAAIIVAVGKAAANTLGDRALLWLPHPFSLRANEGRYDSQLERKIRRIRKALDAGFAPVQHETGRAGQLDVSLVLAEQAGEEATADPRRVTLRVTKSADEKQIVYGLVLDPYMVDTQEEWVPPAVVESAAHAYVKQSRVVGREHVRKDQAELVESWLVHYPSAKDYKAAMSLLPHKVFSMPFGSDEVHSGSWLAGVQLGDAAWGAYKRGEITGFSIGGFSVKTKVPIASMPKVEVVRLVEEAKNAHI